jgi:5-methyltetrahydropteroyltriglutamate--homocysteine methyltransferase
MTFIHTTHVGSLPRTPELAALLLKRDHGETVDEAAFDALVSAEIETAIRAQIKAGVSIVSDGELGKVGYSTYITARLSGFGGHVDRTPAKDLADLPELRTKLAAIMGSQSFVRAACIGKVELVDSKPVEDDVRRFSAAMGARRSRSSARSASRMPPYSSSSTVA